MYLNKKSPAAYSGSRGAFFNGSDVFVEGDLF